MDRAAKSLDADIAELLRDHSSERQWTALAECPEPANELVAKVLAFGHAHLIPEGEHFGEPWIWLPFEVDYLNRVWGAGRHIRRGIMSVARRNGKTGFNSMLLNAFLYGPLVKRGSLILSASMSLEQASVIFKYASKMAKLSPWSKSVTVRETGRRMSCGAQSTEYRAIAADASRAVGFGARVVFFDEAGEIRGTKGREAQLFNNLETSLGSYSDGQMHILSTQAAEDGDLLSILIDDAESGDDDRTVCVLHQAPADCDVLDEKGWAQANPSLGVVRDEEDVRAQAEQAARLPALEADFRRRILNQRVQTGAVWLTSSVWRACRGPVPDFSDPGWMVWGGLDLSGRTDLTALVLLGTRDSETYFARTYAWSPEDTLAERERQDRTEYSLWLRDGWLEAMPGKSIDLELVASRIQEIVEPLNLQFINHDRDRIQYLRKEFDRIDSPLGLEQPDDQALLRPHGQGMRGMGPALESAEHLVLERRLVHDGSPVLTAAVLNAQVVGPDPAGNRKLDKRVSIRRIDAAVALVMACRGAIFDQEELAPPRLAFFV